MSEKSSRSIDNKDIDTRFSNQTKELLDRYVRNEMERLFGIKPDNYDNFQDVISQVYIDDLSDNNKFLRLLCDPYREATSSQTLPEFIKTFQQESNKSETIANFVYGVRDNQDVIAVKEYERAEESEEACQLKHAQLACDLDKLLFSGSLRIQKDNQQIILTFNPKSGRWYKIKKQLLKGYKYDPEHPKLLQLLDYYVLDRFNDYLERRIPSWEKELDTTITIDKYCVLAAGIDIFSRIYKPSVCTQDVCQYKISQARKRARR